MLLLLCQVPHSAWRSVSSEALPKLTAFAFLQTGKVLPEASSLEDVPAKFKTQVEFLVAVGYGLVPLRKYLSHRDILCDACGPQEFPGSLSCTR